MPPKEIISHIKFPLRVRRTVGHVFVEEADGKPRSTVAFTKHVPFSYDYAEFVCKSLARALTDLHEGKILPAVAKPDPVKAPPDDLTFKVELWFDDDSNIQQTLARTAKVTHAKQFAMGIRGEYAGRNLKIRQGIRVIWEAKR